MKLPMAEVLAGAQGREPLERRAPELIGNQGVVDASGDVVVHRGQTLAKLECVEPRMGRAEGPRNGWQPPRLPPEHRQQVGPGGRRSA
jgi:hypothetical protein